VPIRFKATATSTVEDDDVQKVTIDTNGETATVTYLDEDGASRTTAERDVAAALGGPEAVEALRAWARKTVKTDTGLA
jgi:hypothetical protein